MRLEGPLTCSRKLTTETYPEQGESGVKPQTMLSKDALIYAKVFQAVSFLNIFLPKFYMQFCLDHPVILDLTTLIVRKYMYISTCAIETTDLLVSYMTKTTDNVKPLQLVQYRYLTRHFRGT